MGSAWSSLGPRLVTLGVLGLGGLAAAVLWLLGCQAVAVGEGTDIDALRPRRRAGLRWLGVEAETSSHLPP